MGDLFCMMEKDLLGEGEGEGDQAQLPAECEAFRGSQHLPLKEAG